MFINFKNIKITLLFFLATNIFCTDYNYNDIKLGNSIEVTQFEYSDLNDSILSQKSYLFILDTDSAHYKYVYKDNSSIYNITNDSLSKFNYFDGSYFKTQNYFKSFNKPVSEYIYFIQDQKTIEELTKDIKEKSNSYGETDSSYFVENKIYLENINLNRSLKLEWAKNKKDFFIITKQGFKNGDTLKNMWLVDVFKPLTNPNEFKNIKEDNFAYEEKEAKAVKSKVATNALNSNIFDKDSLKNILINNELKGLNVPDAKLLDLFNNKKYLIIYTWGTWCGFCLFNINNVNKFSENVPPLFSFVSFDFENSINIKKEKLLNYFKINNINYPVYHGDEFIYLKNIIEYPNFIVINKNLEVVLSHGGYVKDYNVYLDLLKNLK